MIRDIEGSHIDDNGTNRDVLQFQGTDRIETLHHSTLNITESFTYNVMLRYADLFPELTYTIRCKGEPTTASTGSMFFKSDNGYLRIYLHDTNDTNTLEYVSNDQILNLYEHFLLTIVWDYDIKDITVYINAVPKQMNIVTGGSNHSSASSMGLINTNSSNSYFSYATSQNYYEGYYYYESLDGYAWDSTQVTNKYAELEYTGSYDPIQEIRFFKDNSGSNPYSLYSANENGSNQTVVGAFNSTSYYGLCKSHDGSKLCFSDGSLARVCNIDGSSINSTNHVDFYNYPICFSGDDTKVIGRLGSGGSLKYLAIPLNNGTGTNLTGDGSMSFAGTDTIQYHVRNTKLAISIGNSGNTSNILYSGTIASAGTSWSSMVNILSLGSNRRITNIKLSDDSTIIGYSAPVSSGGIIACYTIPASGGSPTQITDGTYNSYFGSFSPDNTEVLYTQTVDSKREIVRADVDGSDAKVISNNGSNNDKITWLD